MWCHLFITRPGRLAAAADGRDRLLGEHDRDLHRLLGEQRPHDCLLSRMCGVSVAQRSKLSQPISQSRKTGTNRQFGAPVFKTPHAAGTEIAEEEQCKRVHNMFIH